MLVKLFVLGLPGSGKSAIARSIVDYVDHQQVNGWTDQQWSAIRFNDYAILFDMFRQDTKEKRFRAALPGGFDVLDPKVFDEALREFEQLLNRYLNSLKSDEKKLVIVEFSRNDYKHAFQQFNSSFLQDAYFIHLGADVEVCKQRILDRMVFMANDDDYFVSEYIFEKYYYRDDGQDLPHFFKQDFGIDEKRVLTIDNNHSLDKAIKYIAPFIDQIINSASAREGNI